MRLEKSTIREVKRAASKNHKQLASMLNLKEGKLIKCPFHNDHHPSASVGEWGLKCFSGCSRNYDWIEIYRQLNGISFVEAVVQLADICGIIILEESNTIENYNVFDRKKARKQIIEGQMPADFYDLEIIGLDASDNSFCPVKYIDGEFHHIVKEEVSKNDLSVHIDRDGNYILGKTPYYSMRELWKEDKKTWFTIVNPKVVEAYKFYLDAKDCALYENDVKSYYEIDKKLQQIEKLVEKIINCQNTLLIAA